MPVSRRSSILPVIRPIAPSLRLHPFDDPAWVFEPKYDGLRAVFYLGPRIAVFGSKRGSVLAPFRSLAQEVSSVLGVKSAILDGEVLDLDAEGRLHYAAFDLLWLNGRDLRPQSLAKRRQRLGRLIPGTTSVLSRVLVVEEHGRALFDAARRLDLEGIVAKRKADPYRPETCWYEIKNPAYNRSGRPTEAAMVTLLTD